MTQGGQNMKISRWLRSFFCQTFSQRIKGNKRLKGESQAVYRARRKCENRLAESYLKRR
jgi:hypothetical protein